MSEQVTADWLIERGAFVHTKPPKQVPAWGKPVLSFPIPGTSSHMTAPNHIVLCSTTDYKKGRKDLIWCVYVWEADGSRGGGAECLGWIIETKDNFRDLCKLLKIPLKEETQLWSSTIPEEDGVYRYHGDGYYEDIVTVSDGSYAFARQGVSNNLNAVKDHYKGLWIRVGSLQADNKEMYGEAN